MQIVTIYPMPGRTVRDPATGREITGPTRVDGDDGFWIRRLGDKDVTDNENEASAGVPVQAADAPSDEKGAE